jgi:hypothetical protein
MTEKVEEPKTNGPRTRKDGKPWGTPKKTKNPPVSIDHIEKMIQHEKEWSNKSITQIATELRASQSSVRRVMVQLRKRGHYPRKIEQRVASALPIPS